MTISVRSLMVVGVLLALVLLDYSPAAAQYGPPSWAGSTLRGRYHYYNGPHVSYGRGRWGGGISDNGALVLNTLTTTAGAVAPQIIPLFLPTAGNVGSGQSTPGPDGTVGTRLGENAQQLESLDINREARNAKLAAIEERSLDLLKRLKLTDSTPLNVPANSGTSSVGNSDTSSNTEGKLPPGT